MSVPLSDPRPFRGASFAVLLPFLQKVVFLTPLGLHLRGFFGDFLIKNVTFGFELCSLFFASPPASHSPVGPNNNSISPPFHRQKQPEHPQHPKEPKHPKHPSYLSVPRFNTESID